jgi:hexosaminidase
MSVDRSGEAIARSLTPQGSSLKAGSVIGVSLIMLGATVAAGMQVSAGGEPTPDRYPIVPSPVSMVARPGRLRLDSATRIFLSDTANADLRSLADMLAAPLRAASAGVLALPVTLAPGHEGGSNSITIELRPEALTDSESYHLAVTPRGATLSASRPVGLVRGLATIRQLLPPELERPAPARWTIPSVTITDAPRFPYRGVLLDVARWYYPPEFIEKVVDLLALYKLNTLHLHLTDDQGWRLEIKKYPRLTEVGAWRKETILGQNFRPYIGDGKPHGGFYTQQQMRDIVAYAATHHVTIIPEIEMPGHASAALAAYPELSCTGGPFEVSTRWGVHEDIYCPSERTFGFLEDVLTEVMQLFPSRYIHIGGDEVPKKQWKASAVAREVLRREKLANEEDPVGTRRSRAGSLRKRL